MITFKRAIVLFFGFLPALVHYFVTAPWLLSFGTYAGNDLTVAGWLVCAYWLTGVILVPLDADREELERSYREAKEWYDEL